MPKLRLVKNVFQIVEKRNLPLLKGNAGDRIIKQGGGRKAGQRAKQNNTTPGTQLKRMMNKDLWKYAWSTLSGSYLKQQLMFAKNQSQLYPGYLAHKNKTNLREMQTRVIEKFITKPNQAKQSDSAPLSSSVVIWGKGTPNIGQGQYGIGNLELVYAPLSQHCKGGRKPPKTIFITMFPWQPGTMMKAALGMCGTGV